MAVQIWDRAPLLVLSARVYVFLNVLVATCVAAGANALLAWLMYNSDAKRAEVSVWGIPDTLYGDLLWSAIIGWLLTYFVSGYLALRDVTLRFPIGTVLILALLLLLSFLLL
jgi:hypothetical protein